MKLEVNKWIYLFTFFLSPFFLFSQGEWNNWYFGDHAAITFNTNPPSALLNCVMGVTGGYPVSISDSLGNLLFYSDGWLVFNANHSLMPNGSGLNQGLGYQIVFSVKKPGTDHLYYLFHVVDFLPSQFIGLFYSLIDMDLDGGLGDIVPGQKNIPIPGMSDAMDLLTATRHKNNQDVWLITKKYITNQYASILITESGISPTIVLSNSNASVLNVQPGGGELSISPDGQKLICKYTPQNEYAAEFCSFDTEMGSVSPLFNLKLFIGPDQGYISFCGFSPNSKYLYIFGSLPPPSTVGGIYQYDISVPDSTEILNSKIEVWQKPTNPNPFFHFDPPFQIGPDWKLYFPSWGLDSLHVINYPNVQGLGCNVQTNAMSLEGRLNQCGLPQFLQKYKAYIDYTGTCQPDTFHFSSDIWPPADSIRWDFGDPASGPANFSTDPSPDHKFSSPDQYTVELYVRHIDNRTDTTLATINVYPLPTPDLGPDTIICQGDSAIFDAGSCSGCTYQWLDISTGLPAGTAQMLTTSQSGIYAVTVTSGGVCQGRDTVQLTVTPPPLVTNNPLSKSICSGESTQIPLTTNVSGSNSSWTAVSSSLLVSGYGPGTGDTIDQVLSSSSASPETVTYTITPFIGNCQGDSVEYVVTVTSGDSVLVSIAATIDSICEGTQVTYTATSTHSGSTPNYQWKVNGINSGTSDSVFTYIPGNGDSIMCVLTSSNIICTTNNPATSNSIIMSVGEAPDVNFTVCFDTITTLNAKPFKLKGGIPLGGTYSGTGVSNGYFYPGIAGAGSHQITYSYTNFANCDASATATVFNFQFSILNCGDSLTDIRDNKKYPTIQLGSQCWLATNLNYGIQIQSSQNQRDNCIPEKYCFNDIPALCALSSALYQWDELMRYEDTEEVQGLCPPGWHVPSEADWNQLFAVYQGNAFAGSPLVYTGYSGFNVMLAGVEFFNQSHRFADFASILWSSTSHGPLKAWAHGMNQYNYSVSYYPSYRANAFSVRCVRD